GLATGISVVPVPLWTAPALATAAATLGELTGGRFTLGVGSGSIHSAAYRERLGVPDWPPLALMRDYLLTLRPLLAGERVDHTGPAVRLRGVALGARPPHVPVYLGALGPGMLRLAGEAADGAALNWCTPEQIAWSRERVAEGAARAGRDPGEVRIAEYIRVCVDDDEDAARRAYTRAILGYALAQPGAAKDRGYRARFARMGFDAPWPTWRRGATGARPRRNWSRPSPGSSCGWSATTARPRARPPPSPAWPAGSTPRLSASCRPGPGRMRSWRCWKPAGPTASAPRRRGRTPRDALAGGARRTCSVHNPSLLARGLVGALHSPLNQSASEIYIAAVVCLPSGRRMRWRGGDGRHPDGACPVGA
ncbi:MAG: LLM class flavin-dependent oxidoreductase, partial [Chloroflexota bacterium]|nr:LLM class flavin-dependent oxidoreductase [Chloroflexota bacterium]